MERGGKEQDYLVQEVIGDFAARKGTVNQKQGCRNRLDKAVSRPTPRRKAKEDAGPQRRLATARNHDRVNADLPRRAAQ